MKYTYAYRSSDGVRHEESMDAPCREDVFSALRRRGIRAIKVVAADGSKANGEVRGLRKRAVAILLLLVAVGVGVAAFVGGARTGASTPADVPSAVSPRHQIYGDPAVMERIERGDFEGVLAREGDRLLAWFAEPGRLMCPRGADPRSPGARQLAQFAAYVAGELSGERDLPVAADEPREVRELKQIVNGMRGELRAYLANGNGTPRSFWRRLVERTVQEMQIYERTRRELEGEPSDAVWEEKNAALRRLGLRTIPNPKDAD